MAWVVQSLAAEFPKLEGERVSEEVRLLKEWKPLPGCGMEYKETHPVGLLAVTIATENR